MINKEKTSSTFHGWPVKIIGAGTTLNRGNKKTGIKPKKTQPEGFPEDSLECLVTDKNDISVRFQGFELMRKQRNKKCLIPLFSK